MAGLWRLFPVVRPAERRRFAFFFGVTALVTLSQTLGLVGAEALFLARFGIEKLPQAFILASVSTVLAMLLYAALVGVVRNDKMFIHLLWIMAAALGTAAWGLASEVGAVLPALFALYFVGQAVFVNHFWTFAGDYFDILASKRLFPLFTFGASSGGILGGGMAALLSRLGGAETLIVGWALGLLCTSLVIRLGRRDLARWGLIELVEEDETSLEGISAAVRFLRRSSLARWMAVSALGMTLALFVSQFLYSRIFLESFHSAAELAAFFGVFLALSNLGELFVGSVLTPRLIRRLGVARANLVHPLLTLLSFAALALDPRLHAAVLARLNREMVEDSMSTTIRSLTYNAMAQRFRGRVRAFIEGIVVHASISLAGVMLLIWGDVDPRWLCLAGGSMAFLYLITNLRIRSAYLQTLVGGLREGRLDAAQFSERLGSLEGPQLTDLWSGVIASGSGYSVRSAAQLAPALAAREMTEPLLQGLSHPDPGLRRTCLEALAATPHGLPEALLLERVADPDPGVRQACVQALVARERGAAARSSAPRSRTRPVSSEFHTLLGDSDPEVRAETARALGKSGHATLTEMAHSLDPVTAVAALSRLPLELAQVASERAGDPDATVRAAALEAMARLADVVSLGPQRLALDLRHQDARVRGAAVSALAATAAAGSGSLDVIAGTLADPSREVRSRAVVALSGLGEDGARAALPYLRSDLAGTVESAVEVLAPHAFAREPLMTELARRVRLAWGDLLSLQALPPEGEIGTRFLRAAHVDSVRSSEQCAFAALRAIEDPTVVRGIERVLRLGSPRARGQALEVLSNLGDRESAGRLVVILEHRFIEDKIRNVSEATEFGNELSGAVDADRRALDVWIRMGTDYTRKGGGDGVSQRETMERLLLLREVPLFSRLSLEQLDAINQIMQEEHYLRDEVVFREGDPAGALYLLIEGRARIVSDYGSPEEETRNWLEAPSYFGEMAILDDQPRSATVLIVEDARILSLDGESFKELMLQTPEISFEICRVLSSRIRGLESAGAARA